MSCVIQKIKEYASVVRGDVKDANGQVKVLRKAEWRKFIEDTESSVIGWRQYSAHVKGFVSISLVAFIPMKMVLKICLEAS